MNSEVALGKITGRNMMRVEFKEFRASFKTWKDLFSEAAEFATTLDPQRLINISHSGEGEGLVCVWYWQEVEEVRLPEPGSWK